MKSVLLAICLVISSSIAEANTPPGDDIPAHAIELERTAAPVRLAASKFGSFFRNLFKKKQPAEDPNQAPAAPELDLRGLSREKMGSAIKDALQVGLTNAVNRLSRSGAFLTNKDLRITMPERLKPVADGLRKLGQDRVVEVFEATMNTAAEKAIPAAGTVFQDALKKMTVNDAADILNGRVDSATQWFRKNTEAELTGIFRAEVKKATASAGLTSAYKALVEKIKYGASLLNYDVEDLDKYITDKTLDGLFKVVAEEEKKIRQNPIGQGSQLLQAVFGRFKR